VPITSTSKTLPSRRRQMRALGEKRRKKPVLSANCPALM
jgi:hypothetical protein